MTVCSMKSLLSDSFAGEWGSESGEVLTPVLRTANFNDDGSLDYDSPAYRCIPEKKVQTKRMLRGDIILEKSGGTPNRPVGIMAYYDSDDEALCSNFNHVLRFNADSVNPFFMFHQLRWLREKGAFSPYTRKTTGLQNLQMKTFVGLELKVPAKAKQDEVAATIRAIDLRRNELKKLLGKLDELVKSRFVEMFGNPETNPMGWETRSIGELATDVRYGTSKPASADGKYTYIRMNNMTYEGGLDLSDTKRITLDGKELDKALVRYGDLLFNRTNSRDKVGKTCVFKLDEPMVIAGYIIRVRLCDDIEAEYLSTYLNTSHAKRMLKEMAHGAVNQANINAKEMQSIIVTVPPIELQKEFLVFVQQVDKLKFKTQQAIDKLQMLYDSLAQEYFAS